jgi:hypothetical protein
VTYSMLWYITSIDKHCMVCVLTDTAVMIAVTAAAGTDATLLSMQVCGYNEELIENTKYRRILFALIPPTVSDKVSQH